ncbi:MAG: hypothetical protein Kow00129_08300 [Thermoleophilia bacterium]
MFFGMLLWPLLIVGVIWLLWQSQNNRTQNYQENLRTPFAGHTGSSQTTGAREVLDERYARGEIDRDEYLERRRVLGYEI